MSNLAFDSKHKGGLCYAACQDLFNWYNPNVLHCRKGCDFATGRVNTPEERAIVPEMCKRYTTELYATDKGELESIRDLRVHADMFPTSPDKLYRACLAGARRQRF